MLRLEGRGWRVTIEDARDHIPVSCIHGELLIHCTVSNPHKYKVLFIVILGVVTLSSA